MLDKIKRRSNIAATKLEAVLASKFFLIGIFIWFAVQSTYMALATRFKIPPDEKWHVRLIQYYATKVTPFIHNQTGHYNLGEITRNTSWLYQYSLSFLYRISPFGEQTTIYLLRSTSILLGLLSLYFIYKLMVRLKLSPVVRNIALFLWANTLMFVFLSSGLNYDNLAILLAIMSFYFLAGLLSKFSIKEFYAFCLVMALGLATKYTLLPLDVLMVLVLLWQYRNKVGEVATAFKTALKNNTRRVVALTTVILVVIGICGYQYAANLLTYHSVNPGCQRVHTIQQCEENGIYKRDEQLKADAKTSTIVMMPIDEFIFHWQQFMRQRTLGITGAKSTQPNNTLLIITELFTLIVLVAAIKEFRIKDKNINILLAIALIYMAVLLLENYLRYHRVKQFGIALQGRYGFVVLYLIYAAGLNYLWKFLKDKQVLRMSIIGVVMLAFFLSSLPSYISKTDISWHTTKMQTLNSKLQKVARHLTP